MATTPANQTAGTQNATELLSDNLNANARNAFLSGFLGWTLDAFNFFVLIYVLSDVAADFHRPIADMAFALTASLMARPLGAIIFGLMADRYGRRMPLVLNIIFYTAMQVFSGMASSYSAFIVLRLLYGIGMGGAWGVATSLAMESAPAKWRGIFSGILQEGYVFGNLLAAVAFWVVLPRWGWRPIFFLGVIPAIPTLWLLSTVKETGAWKSAAAKAKSWGEYFGLLAVNWKRCAYLIVLLIAMTFISHGTQDMYPTFLQKQHGFAPRAVAMISVISMIGAMFGGTLGGAFSQRHGRRRIMIVAAVLGLILIPLWVLVSPTPLIAVGAFLMQFMVQAAWGVVPAHMSELSPGPLRGFVPGFAYQVGVLVSASAPYIEARMTHYLTYGQSLGIFAAMAFVLGVIVIAVGPEAHGVKFETSES